jgi:uncharacterized protein YgbK (DUF1537 family)
MPARDRYAGVAVVADDLTGAADTAVHFIRRGHEVRLVSLALGAPDLPESPEGGLAVDTATRGCAPARTVREVRRAARLVGRFRGALVYKKVDSQLRGRPGLEIETLRRDLGLRCALVAPAHPDEGRVTREGVHLVHGVPVADADAGRDPVSPVAESRLPELVAGQAGVPVAHVSMADLERGPAHLERRIDGLVAEGYKAITFDAIRRRDLDRIADAASGRLAEVLLAGSAGLAAALAGSCSSEHPASTTEAPRFASMLLVCGSTAPALRRQVARLAASGRSVAITWTPASPAGETGREERSAALEAWAGQDVVLQAPRDRLDVRACAPSALVAGLAELAVAMVARRRPDALFLSGGDTARAVLKAAGAAALRLRGEAAPGVAWGLASGGMLDGLAVLTRSGAFGGEEDLLALYDGCMRGREA